MNKQQQPDSGTRYTCPLFTCVPSFNLLGLSSHKSVTKNFHVENWRERKISSSQNTCYNTYFRPKLWTFPWLSWYLKFPWPIWRIPWLFPDLEEKSNFPDFSLTSGHPVISLWEIFQSSRAANSIVSGPIWPKFVLIRDLMHVLVTCKYKKNRIKNNWENMETSFSPL